ncbi:MAG: hypothetical protein IJK23_11950 [Clostridia bacterium]|nr:hypothetical protein [Clostridia bacterium]
MKQIRLIDTTLSKAAELRKSAMSFKEKLETALAADRLRVDAIELPAVSGGKADLLFNKTVAGSVSTAVFASIPITEKEPERIYESIRLAKSPAIDLVVPSSPVQMEYTGHMKAPAMLDAVDAQVKKCVSFGCKSYITFEDATRAEPDFLVDAVRASIAAGASGVTFCDTAGVFLPDEFSAFIRNISQKVPEIENVSLFVQISDEMSMAAACTAAAIAAGADGVKCTAIPAGCTTLGQISQLVRVKGAALDISIGLKTTELTRTGERLSRMIGVGSAAPSVREVSAANDLPNVTLSQNDELSDVIKVVRQLGYDLSDDDNAKVYEAFKRIASKKQFVGSRELDAIVASTAMQVPSSYRLESYVINSGNVLTATANITLTQNGEKRCSVGVGDGPIDAAFQAIEQIIGHHYEMDDFQIQTVTEGREAMGSAIVKLRADGKLFSGSGISTDIIGASIRAYVSALNKIVYEEA